MERLGTNSAYDPLTSPPPPPPPPSYSVQSDFEVYSSPGNDVDPSQYAGNITHIERRQDALRDAHDGYVGSRFRLKEQRETLRNRREQAGIQASLAFGLFHNLLLQQKTQLPAEIADAFSEASALRDNLGQLDIEYDEMEDAYNTLEWNYKKIEDKFVQEFAGGSKLSGVSTEQLPYSESQYWTQFSAGPFSSGILPSPMDISHDIAQSVDGPIDVAETSPGTRLQSQKPSLWSPQSVTSALEMVSFPPVVDLAKPSSRSSNGSNVEFARSSWRETRKRIDEWLLDILSNSSLQRAQLKAMLAQNDLESTWLALVKEYWSSDNLDLLSIQAGESGVSNAEAVRAKSASAGQSFPITPPPGWKEVIMNVCENLSPLTFTTEPFSNNNAPMALEQSDLIEADVTLENQRVVVREPENQPCLPSSSDSHEQEDRESLHEYVNESVKSRNSREIGDGVYGTFSQSVTDDAVGPSISSPFLTVHTPQWQGIRPHSPASNPEHTMLNPNTLNHLPSPYFTDRPISPPKTPSPSPERQRRCPLAPFFQGDHLQAWVYLKPMTPFRMYTCEGCDHSLSTVPSKLSPNFSVRPSGPPSSGDSLD
ncbi:hypothetical protein GQ44DRAFT_769823 [Phaeosphaeriaceae sp. PMI808]|nr:hypothetical protein GQ44DRAFT_769823 [Phaeosphaeriaceae sp. PMI808]